MSMYVDEESDEGTVPMKRSNKEGYASAEDVEGRTSPKGNGGESAAVRTPSRDAASIGLAAVRQAARRSKSVRFTALLHHITVDLLKQSYTALARDAAPGIDGDDMNGILRKIFKTSPQNKRCLVYTKRFYLMRYIRYICSWQLAHDISPGGRHIIIPVSEICSEGNYGNCHGIKKQNYLIFMLLG